MMRLSQLAILILGSIGMIACQRGSTQSAISVTQTLANSVEAVPTIITEISPRPTYTFGPTSSLDVATYTPQPSPIGTTTLTNPLPSEIWDNTYLADSTICELPCWNGLLVGESRLEDAQEVMETVFGLETFQAKQATTIGPADIPDLYFVEYKWLTPNSEEEEDKFNGLLRIRFWIENGSDVIKMLGINWVNAQTGIPLRRTIGNVLTASDSPPDQILVGLDQTERSDVLSMSMHIIYKDGHGASLNLIIPATQMTEQGLPEQAELCLQKEFEGALYIAEPYLDDVGNFDPMQEYLFSSSLELPSIEGYSDITNQELYDLALNEPSSCISISLP